MMWDILWIYSTKTHIFRQRPVRPAETRRVARRRKVLEAMEKSNGKKDRDGSWPAEDLDLCISLSLIIYTHIKQYIYIYVDNYAYTYANIYIYICTYIHIFTCNMIMYRHVMILCNTVIWCAYVAYRCTTYTCTYF